MNFCARIEPNIAEVGALMGDPSRAAILTILLDGRSISAGELASAAGVGATAASAHFNKLTQSGLIAMERQGRHRYYRLVRPEVAAAIESLAQLAPLGSVFKVPRLSPSAQVLRFARSCYDHLAGELGVAVAASLEQRGWLLRSEHNRYELRSGAAREWFRTFGVDIIGLRQSRQAIAKRCLDWTERRPHLGGPLGSALLKAWCDLNWMKRGPTPTRLVQVTEIGRRNLRRKLGIHIIKDGTTNFRVSLEGDRLLLQAKARDRGGYLNA